jgi:hypothetical protein
MMNVDYFPRKKEYTMNFPKKLAMFSVLGVFASLACADVVFEEFSKTEGGAMSMPASTKKIFISGDKFRAQSKMNIDAGNMSKQMNAMQQMQGVNQKEMNKIARAGRPNFPAKILTLEEWISYPENADLMKDPLKPENQKTIRDTYAKEVDAGLKAKFEDEAADEMAAGAGIGAVFAKRLSYEDWLRIKIIRDAVGDSSTYEQQKAMEASGFGGRSQMRSLQEIQKISDPNSKEYKKLVDDYNMNPSVKAEYAKLREGNKDAQKKMGNLGNMMSQKISEEAPDIQLSVQLVRLDQGKLIEIIPPKQGKKDATAADLTYKEKSLGTVRDDIAQRQSKMKEGAAKMKSDPRYAQFAAQMAPKVSKIGNEVVNGISCEHWKVVAGSTEHDYWVAADFPGAKDIKAFDSKLQSTIGDGRDALASQGGGGMPSMGGMMGSMGTSEETQQALDNIEAKGIVLKHVTR